MSRESVLRLHRRWKRLFERRDPYPWEMREAEKLLYEVSKSACACKLVSELLEIQGDPGESMADYVSDCLRQPTIERAKWDHHKYLEEINGGFSNG